jgi:hypothetical protein
LARDAECSNVGPNCREGTNEAAAKAGKLSAVLGNRALTERAEALDGETAELERELRELGPVPLHSDDTAAKVARIVGAFVQVGKGIDAELS